MTAAAVDRYLMPAGPTAATLRTLLQRATDETDRRTDGHRTVTFTLPHTVRAVSITILIKYSSVRLLICL